MDELLDRVLHPKHHLRPVPHGEEHTFLLGERERFLVSGRPQALLLRLLDGRRTVREVLAELEGHAFLPEVYFTLEQMLERGELVDATPELPAEVAAFWQAQGVPPHEAARRLAATRVAVESMDGLDPEPFAQALRELGVPVSPAGSLRVVLVRDYLSSSLEAFNRQALQARSRWMVLKPLGTQPWWGPLFLPGSGPCWECLASRLRANRPVESFLQGRTDVPLLPPATALPASLQATFHLAALTLARQVAAAASSGLESTLLSLDCTGPRLAEHAVVRRPQCPACGNPSLLRERARRPLQLLPRPKRFTEDGGHRTLSPEEAFSRLEPLVDPITGVISSLGPLEDSEPPMRVVYAATYYMPLPEGTPDAESFHTSASGKGRTPAQARMSCLGEAVERWSALFQGDEPRVHARLSELGEEAIAPQALLHFSESQYQQRQATNARSSSARIYVPPPFDERQPIDWAPLWSLTHGRTRYLPASHCYGRYPAPAQQRFCEWDSNGNAAGACLEEAIYQGFLELAERDATALWWYNRLRRPGVDLGSFGEPYFSELHAWYRRLGWELWALDLTHDLEIPCFVVLGHSERERRWCMGFGSHLEARIALQRALTEHNQIFRPDPRVGSTFQADRLEDLSFLYPDPGAAPRTRADFPAATAPDLTEDVHACVARAARLGLETLVLDQTRPDVGLCAVKVVVPGLRHFWPRFGPGRLYEVPVRLGWLPAPLTESQLNPVHLFL